MNGRMEAEQMAAEHEARNCQRWISVSEDLPERSKEVLVTNGTRCGVAWFVDGYIDAVPLQEWEGTPIVPTHWMPLPEPPPGSTTSTR